MGSRKKKNQTYVWLCFGAGFALTAASLPFAPEAALILFCLTLFCGFWMTENTRRAHWEMSHSFKIRKMEKDAQGVTGTLARHEEALQDIRKDIAALERKHSSAEPVTLAKPLNTKPELRAVKPAHKRSYNDLFNSPRPFSSSPVMAANVNDTPVQEDSGYSDLVVSELLDHAIRTNSLEVFVQPIVRLPSRQVRYFEMFARLRAKPGTYIPARRFGEDGKRLDRLMLVRCLDLLKAAPRGESLPPFFLNIAPETLKDAAFMRALLPFAAQNRDLMARVIFEIPYASFRTLDAPARKVMEGLARLGCSFSLDHIETVPAPAAISLEEFMHYRIKAVKLDAGLFLGDIDTTGLMRLKSRLEGNAIAVIVTGIENETRMRQLLPFVPNYGQGYLFGRPDLKGAYLNAGRRAQRNINHG